MSKEIELTSPEGGRLLSDCFNVVIPRKIEGLGTWDQQAKAVIDRNVRQLLKALKEVSPIFRKTKRTTFGPAEWYDEQKREVDPAQKEKELDASGEQIKTRHVLKDEHKHSTAKVTLNGQAEKGMSILLLLRLHPGPCFMDDPAKPFSQALTPGYQDEQVWPMAEKLGIARDLEVKLGLTKGANEGPTFKSDEDYAREEADRKLKLVNDEKPDTKAEEPAGRPSTGTG